MNHPKKLEQQKIEVHDFENESAASSYDNYTYDANYNENEESSITEYQDGYDYENENVLSKYGLLPTVEEYPLQVELNEVPVSEGQCDDSCGISQCDT